MTAAASANGLPFSSTIRTPGGAFRLNSPGSPGSVLMSLSSHHDAGLSPAYEISRSRQPSSESTITSAGKNMSGAMGSQSSPRFTLSWYPRRPR